MGEVIDGKGRWWPVLGGMSQPIIYIQPINYPYTRIEIEGKSFRLALFYVTGIPETVTQILED